MAVTTDSIADALQKIVSLLEIDTEDQGKINLAITLLKLVINYIGIENITEGLGESFDEAYALVEDYIEGVSSDLTLEERTERLAITRKELDDIFEQIAAVHD
jgi:hypothetical protein